MGEFADRFIQPVPYDIDAQVLHTILKWAAFSFAIMAISISTGFLNIVIYETVIVVLFVLVFRRIAGMYHDKEDADREFFRQYGNSNTFRNFQAVTEA